MGSSKKVTVGHKYFLGFHVFGGLGPWDYITRFLVDNKVAWRGFARGGSININKPDLFGGEKREGGVSGQVDIEMGLPDQGRNSYLQKFIGVDIPAFRGVVGLVFRSFYLGLNPYLKKWKVRGQRIHVLDDGEPQWYDAKAAIGYMSNVALYLAIDISDSMGMVTSNGETRLVNMKTALEAALQPLVGLPAGSPIDIMVVGFAGSTVSITRRDISGLDVQDIIGWINARDFTDVSNGETDYEAAVSAAPEFFAGAGDKNRVSIFITDGLPSVHGVSNEDNVQAAYDTLFEVVTVGGISVPTSDVEAYAINIDLSDITYSSYLDNTNDDGVPIVDGGSSSQLAGAVLGAIFAHFEMNPAHIVRECVTARGWGLGAPESRCDDTVWQPLADQLYSEGFGLGFFWDEEGPIEDFIAMVCKHIGADFYSDRFTGDFHLKLIRDDYDPEEVLHLDESSIVGVNTDGRPLFDQLKNSVTIEYWDYKTGNKGSVTVRNDALIQAQGKVNNVTRSYMGISNAELAVRVGMRDLRALSTPLMPVEIEATRVAGQLNKGWPVKVTWPELDLYGVVLRVQSIDLGDGLGGAVKLKAIEDVFAFPDAADVSVAVGVDEDWVDPSLATIEACPAQVVVEAPYYELVQQQGETAVNDLLAADPDAGFVMAAGSRPGSWGVINAGLLVDAGAGYEESDTVEFSPHAFADGAAGYGQTVVPIRDGVDLDIIELGTHVQWDDELCRVDAVSDTSVTLGRGVLDTVPAEHADGSVLVFWDQYPATDEVQYADGETVNVKLIPSSGNQVLDSPLAPVSVVTMDSRAVRPYPPGNLKINGVAYPDYFEGELSLSYSDRDRLQQTSGTLYDTTAGNIGPEAGTTYTLRLYGEADTLLRTEAGLTVTAYTYAAADEINDSLIPIDGSSSGEIQTEVFDSFTDGDGVQLTAHDLDTGSDSWENIHLYALGEGAHASILSNQAVVTQNNTGVVVDSGVSDCVISMDWTTDAANTDRKMIVFRWASQGNSLAFKCRGPDNDWSVDKIESGSLTSLVSDSYTFAASTTYALKVELFGSSIKAFINGVLVASVTDSTFKTETHHGFARANGSDNGFIDDFYVETKVPEYRLNGRLRFELESERDGYVSRNSHNFAVRREGYGFNYGISYGGA